uniref:EF-hand domain-containing protein n=1 Tax=Kudoa septempunctata TaxID=751907 RepID=A0A292GES7_9CNID|nr:hypothetical protein [Kudoa septempunctata]
MFSKKKCCLETKKLSSRFNVNEDCLKRMRKALIKRMKSHSLNKAEFTDLMVEEGLDSNEASSLFDVLDLDRSGTLDSDEILMMLVLKHSNENNNKNENMDLLFEINDVNKSGTIDAREFIRMVKIYHILSDKSLDGFNENKVQTLFRSIDRNNSGSLSRKEFNNYISANPHAFDIVFTPSSPSGNTSLND